MSTLEEEVQRARLAQEILSNELFKEAFQSISAQILQMWNSTAAEQAKEREILWMELKLLQRLEQIFKNTVEDGKLAERNIKDLQLKNR